jgi:hypothetical protein
MARPSSGWSRSATSSTRPAEWPPHAWLGGERGGRYLIFVAAGPSASQRWPSDDHGPIKAIAARVVRERTVANADHALLWVEQVAAMPAIGRLVEPERDHLGRVGRACGDALARPAPTCRIGAKPLRERAAIARGMANAAVGREVAAMRARNVAQARLKCVGRQPVLHPQPIHRRHKLRFWPCQLCGRLSARCGRRCGFRQCGRWR